MTDRPNFSKIIDSLIILIILAVLIALVILYIYSPAAWAWTPLEVLR